MDNTLRKDIVIIGGGTAGCAAAIATARRGHSVLLVEENNCLGGVSTAGGVSEWFARDLLMHLACVWAKYPRQAAPAQIR